MRSKSALITGITGQDGSFLTKLLLEKGYKVYGLMSGKPEFDVFDNFNKLGISEQDVNKILFEDIGEIKEEINEVYNFVGLTSVSTSWKNPLLCYELNLIQYLKIIEIFKNTNTRILQASSAEMFEDKSGVINEKSQLNPDNPYAVSKYAAYKQGILERTANNVFISNAILFNHESELRPPTFVTRKITDHVANYKKGKREILKVGNINASRDWGYAGEYVDAMHRILQHSEADDFVISTGKSYTVREFISIAFEIIGVDVKWIGEGIDEKGFNSKTNEVLVEISEEFYRPIDKHLLVGDSSKAEEILSWKAKLGIKEIIEKMLQA